MMKNIIEKFQICLVLSALLFSSFVAACSGNDDTVTPEITIPANILTDGMTFSKTGGTSTLNIKSNVALEVTSSAPEWCKVTAESSASSSILKYTVMAEANTDTSDREAKVTVKAGGSEVGSFTVKQTAADGLIISNSTSFDLPAAGGDVSVVVETNGDVQAVSDVSWIKAVYNPQIQISAESETKRSIFRKRDKTKRSKKESAQHSKSRNKSFVMTSVSAL